MLLTYRVAVLIRFADVKVVIIGQAPY
eukprot:COSAG01_NODE_49582_length_371_cov_0.566176_1_plen_26_part_10